MAICCSPKDDTRTARTRTPTQSQPHNSRTPTIILARRQHASKNHNQIEVVTSISFKCYANNNTDRTPTITLIKQITTIRWMTITIVTLVVTSVLNTNPKPESKNLANCHEIIKFKSRQYYFYKAFHLL